MPSPIVTLPGFDATIAAMTKEDSFTIYLKEVAMIKRLALALMLAGLAAGSKGYSQATGYGVDGSVSPASWVSFPVPGTLASSATRVIGSTAANGQGGDFGEGGAFFTRITGSLASIDTATGAATTIAPITGVSAGFTMIGFAYDPLAKKMYLAATNFSTATAELYTIDLATAAATRIGIVTNSPGLLAIAASCAGELYGVDGTNNSLIRISPATGAGTVVGALGIDVPLVAQDADFDPASGVLYWAVFIAGSTSLRSIDTATGASTFIRTIAGDIVAFGIPGVCRSSGLEQEKSNGPEQFDLGQNYPNPFSAPEQGFAGTPGTTISFRLPVSAEVTLAIYSLSGQLVKQVARGAYPSGQHQIVWDATNERGERAASGVYLYVLKAGEFTAQRKLVLMRR
jgi:hypothetical protein